jgi:hypothetical protein
MDAKNMTKLETLTFEEAIKEIPKDKLVKLLLTGEITPLVKNPETGILKKFKINEYNPRTGKIKGYFLDDAL